MILGMPGTGKTATVREVIRELREEIDFNVRLLLFCWMEIVFRDQRNESHLGKRGVFDAAELHHS